MSTQEININVTGETKELIFRKGDALPVKHKDPINLSGTLEAPFQYYEGKKGKGEFLPDDCHLQILKDKGKIVLVVNDQNPFSKCTVTGSLNLDSILQQFKINSDHRWTIQEFLKFIKTMRFYFADRSAHASLVASLQKWSVKVERVIVEHNDNKGNSNFQLETKVQESAKDSLISKFDLLIPIFQGYSKVKFTVEIGLDPKNTHVMIYLISDDLIELEIGQREKHIQDVLDKFNEFPCSKVVIS